MMESRETRNREEPKMTKAKSKKNQVLPSEAPEGTSPTDTLTLTQ